MLKRRRPLALVVPVLVLGVVGLSACGSGEAAEGSGLSLADKAKTVKVCADVAGSAQSAADVGSKVAQGAITQAEAATQLEPISAEAAGRAEQNASLPIGKSLKKLSDSIAALQKVDPNTPTDFQAAADALATEAKAVVADCTDVGK